MTYIMIILVLLIVTCVGSHISSFQPSAIVEIFQNYRPTYFIFTQSESVLQNYQQILTASQQTLTQQNLFFCFPKPEEEGYHNLLRYLGVMDAEGEIRLYLPYNKKYRYVEKFEAEELVGFKKLAEDGELEEVLNSEVIGYEGQKGVIELMGKTLEEYFEPFQEQEVVVLLYTRESESCKPVQKIMSALAEDLSANTNLLFGKLDLNRNEIGMWEKYLTVTIPMLVFWQRDKNIAPFVYEQPFQYEHIKRWIQEKTLYEWLEPSPKQQPVEPTPLEPAVAVGGQL